MAVEDDAAKVLLPMRTILGCAVLALAFSTATIPAQAKGCIKGALIGGTAGHFAGHHGLLGAAAGCVIGRHEANRQRQLKLQRAATTMDAPRVGCSASEIRPRFLQRHAVLAQAGTNDEKKFPASLWPWDERNSA